jgi:hypothetical protein
MEERPEKKLEDGTYAYGCSLNEEADEVETQLAMRCEGNAGRDHEDNDGQFAVGLLDSEGPRDKEDGNGGERLDKCYQEVESRGGGKRVSAFSICM